RGVHCGRTGHGLSPRLRGFFCNACREFMTIAAHGIRAKLLQEAQSSADGEPRRKVARSRPVELGGETAPVVVRDRERMNQRSAVAARPQETAAARRKEPLVAIAGVPV